MTLKELRQSQGISAKDMVAVIQQVHPRYDKTLQSKVESGEYGITLSQEAMERVEQEFPEIKTSKRSGDRHRLKPDCQMPSIMRYALRLRLTAMPPYRSAS